LGTIARKRFSSYKVTPVPARAGCSIGVDSEEGVMKKVYEKPAVIHTEKIEARAVTCAKDSATTSGCEAGPITS